MNGFTTFLDKWIPKITNIDTESLEILTSLDQLKISNIPESLCFDRMLVVQSILTVELCKLLRNTELLNYNYMNTKKMVSNQ
jgi:hypothetical protein